MQTYEYKIVKYWYLTFVNGVSNGDNLSRVTTVTIISLFYQYQHVPQVVITLGECHL